MLLFPVRNCVIVVKAGTSVQADCLGLGPVLVWLSRAPTASLLTITELLLQLAHMAGSLFLKLK